MTPRMLLLPALLLCAIGIAQSPADSSPTSPHSASSSALSDPQYKGQRTLLLFKDDPHPARFTLITSWVPGTDNKGYFRYQVTMGATAAFDIPPVHSASSPHTEERSEE